MKIDGEAQNRTIEFIERQAKAGKPFYVANFPNLTSFIPAAFYFLPGDPREKSPLTCRWVGCRLSGGRVGGDALVWGGRKSEQPILSMQDIHSLSEKHLEAEFAIALGCLFTGAKHLAFDR